MPVLLTMVMVAHIVLELGPGVLGAPSTHRPFCSAPRVVHTEAATAGCVHHMALGPTSWWSHMFCARLAWAADWVAVHVDWVYGTHPPTRTQPSCGAPLYQSFLAGLLTLLFVRPKLLVDAALPYRSSVSLSPGREVHKRSTSRSRARCVSADTRKRSFRLEWITFIRVETV